jgi:hypothetical protein
MTSGVNLPFHRFSFRILYFKFDWVKKKILFFRLFIIKLKFLFNHLCPIDASVHIHF